jgi:hypothetical protein
MPYATRPTVKHATMAITRLREKSAFPGEGAACCPRARRAGAAATDAAGGGEVVRRRAG